MSAERLDLFSLNVVLFPGMGLPLHVFEERYRQMIAECLQRDRRFGVCLIRSGSEVGEPAEPYLTGTEAEIVSVRHAPDGRMNILAVGRRRFRVVEITQWRPWVAGEVAYPTAEVVEAGLAAGQQVREELAGYLQRMLELAGRAAAPLMLPRDPVGISYAAGALLQIAPSLKQQLLEEPRTEARLARVLEHLREAQLEQEALLRLQREHPELGALADENGLGPITRN
jgi:uncharacterized protein